MGFFIVECRRWSLATTEESMKPHRIASAGPLGLALGVLFLLALLLVTGYEWVSGQVRVYVKKHPPNRRIVLAGPVLWMVRSVVGGLVMFAVCYGLLSASRELMPPPLSPFEQKVQALSQELGYPAKVVWEEGFTFPRHAPTGTKEDVLKVRIPDATRCPMEVAFKAWRAYGALRKEFRMDGPTTVVLASLETDFPTRYHISCWHSEATVSAIGRTLPQAVDWYGPRVTFEEVWSWVEFGPPRKLDVPPLPPRLGR